MIITEPATNSIKSNDQIFVSKTLDLVQYRQYNNSVKINERTTRHDKKGRTTMIYGYARISTPKQSIDRQLRNILSYDSSARIYQEAFTGKVIARPEWEKLMKRVKAGDVIVFDSVSRMSRNAAEGVETYFDLFNKGVSLVFLKEPAINTDTYQAGTHGITFEADTGDADADELLDATIKAINKYAAALAKKQIALAFQQSQKEVDDLSQRTKEGLVTAKANGKQIGNAARHGNMYAKKAERVKEIIRQRSVTFGGHDNDIDLLTYLNGDKKTHVARGSYYKYKREIVAELNAGTRE